MNNKFLFQDNLNKNNPNFHRNSSLDSTKSSLRVKKIKLHNEFTPFYKITVNQNVKNILDFPICMSLFTNNYSVSEKDKTKSNSNNNIKINYQNLKNNIINKDKQIKNDLFLPKTKKIISRNGKGIFVKSFSPINSLVKSSILNNNHFSSSRSNSNILLKRINYSPLINFTKKTDNEIKILKKYKYLNNYSKSNTTLEQEISAIKNLKNNSFGKINYNINIKNDKNMKLPKYFFTPKDKSQQNEKKVFPTAEFYLNEENKEKENILYEESSLTNKSNDIFKTINTNFKKFNILENINNISINKNKKSILEKKNKANINNKENEKQNKYKRRKKKIGTDRNKKNKNKDFENITNAFKRKSLRKKTIQIPENKKYYDIEEKYPIKLMIERDKLQRIKASKFYLAINNMETNDIYNKNIFLNDLNKIITEKSINNRLNTKIFLQKTEMLMLAKVRINLMIIKQQTKLKKIDLPPNENASIQTIMYKYIKPISTNKKEIMKYKNTEVSFNKIKIIFKNNCKIHDILRDYIVSIAKFSEINLLKPKKKGFKKQGSLLQRQNKKNDIKNFKRVNTYNASKRISFYHNLEDGFTLKKTTNNIKKDIKIFNVPIHLITIQDYILKSLPYYKKNNFEEDEHDFLLEEDKRISIKKKAKLYYKANTRNLSKNFSRKNNLVINSSKILLRVKKRSSFNLNNEKLHNIKITRKDLTGFNLDDLIKNQISQSPDFNLENYSILQRKHFFKISKMDNNLKTLKISKKNALRNDSMDLININDIQDIEKDEVNYKKIYFELIKLAIEGKNKAFEKYYEKNKKYIDINQRLYDGNTLLLLCAREGNYHITKFLLEEKAEVNIVNNNGNTALHYAIGKQFYAIADILARYGAREDIKNIKGLTPWDCIENNIE